MKIVLALALIASQAFAASYNQPLNCAATSIALNAPSTSATVQCPDTPPPPTSATCQPGLGSDLPNQHAVCAGAFKHNVVSSVTTSDSGNWTFDKVFGATWPGSLSTANAIFTLQPGQYVAIPFKPTPGHTVDFLINSTFTNARNITGSIATVQGVFTDGNPNVVCNAARDLNLVASSNGSAGACKLDPTKNYWLNLIPGTVQPRQPISASTFVPCTVGNCIVAVQGKFQN